MREQAGTPPPCVSTLSHNDNRGLLPFVHAEEGRVDVLCPGSVKSLEVPKSGLASVSLEDGATLSTELVVSRRLTLVLRVVYGGWEIWGNWGTDATLLHCGCDDRYRLRSGGCGRG